MGGGLSRFHSAHVLIMGAIIRGKCPTILQQQARVQKLVCNIGKGKTVCIVVTVAIVQGLLMYCVH